jgi:hypothetical protein
MHNEAFTEETDLTKKVKRLYERFSVGQIKMLTEVLGT